MASRPLAMTSGKDSGKATDNALRNEPCQRRSHALPLPSPPGTTAILPPRHCEACGDSHRRSNLVRSAVPFPQAPPPSPTTSLRGAWRQPPPKQSRAAGTTVPPAAPAFREMASLPLAMTSGKGRGEATASALRNRHRQSAPTTLHPGQDYRLFPKSPVSMPYYVYILTNKRCNVLYVGVTNNLRRRLEEHRSGYTPRAFTCRYNVNRLIYYECYTSINEAIQREKQLKAGSRKKKEALIHAFNPDWRDLAQDIMLLE